MERWHTSWLGLKQFPTELSAFDLDQFFTLDEPPRVYRRLHYLREWSYEQEHEIFPASAGKSGTAAI